MTNTLLNDLSSLEASIKTSVMIKLFKNDKISFEYHITKTKQKLLNLSLFKNGKIDNFNPNRLSGNTIISAFPISNRPRGKKDISSVKYHIKQIKLKKYPYIWIAKKKNKYILLDGAHRIVAYHLCNKEKIPTYIVHL